MVPLLPSNEYLSAIHLTITQFHYLRVLFYNSGPLPDISPKEKEELLDRNLIEDGHGDHLTRLGRGFVKAMGDILKTMS